MSTLFPIFALAIIFAYLTERTTWGSYEKFRYQSSLNTLFYVLLLITLILPIGLRRIYNDTGSYIRGFEESMDLIELLRSGDLELLKNPAFQIYTALIRTFTDNFHVYFMIAAVFVQTVYVSAIRKFSHNFTLTIGLYICLGTYVFSIAAMKQTIAMAILLLAIPNLLERKYGKFYLIVFLAFLFHTYAIAFVFLPLLQKKVWSFWTLIILGGTVFVMKNFEPVIGSFLEYANEQGKVVADYEIFDNNSVNIFRVLVYTVLPMLSLVFKKYVVAGDEKDGRYNLFLHMSVISFAFMLLGTVQGANMFARMAFYFEFGLILGLPWIIHRVFDRRSATIISMLAAGCFFVFFHYANEIALDFDSQYRAISLSEFLISLI